MRGVRNETGAHPSNETIITRISKSSVFCHDSLNLSCTFDYRDLKVTLTNVTLHMTTPSVLSTTAVLPNFTDPNVSTTHSTPNTTATMAATPLSTHRNTIGSLETTISDQTSTVTRNETIEPADVITEPTKPISTEMATSTLSPLSTLPDNTGPTTSPPTQDPTYMSHPFTFDTTLDRRAKPSRIPFPSTVVPFSNEVETMPTIPVGSINPTVTSANNRRKLLVQTTTEEPFWPIDGFKAQTTEKDKSTGIETLFTTFASKGLTGSKVCPPGSRRCQVNNTRSIFKPTISRSHKNMENSCNKSKKKCKRPKSAEKKKKKSNEKKSKERKGKLKRH